jgi:hypothetical protein
MCYPSSRILVGKPEKDLLDERDRITVQFSTTGRLELNWFRIWLNHELLLAQFYLACKTESKFNIKFKFIS